MQKSNIEWCDITMNPVVGCENNCMGFECYAKALHNRRHELFKKGKKMPNQYAKPFNEIQFFPERLSRSVPKLAINRNRIAPLLSPDKSIVFVGSMADTFGDFVNIEYIRAILEYTQKNKHALFMFLTKNPKRYNEIPFFDSTGKYFENIVLGCTIESIKHIDRLQEMRNIAPYMPTFLSVEPILSDFKYIDFSAIGTIIVGAATGKNAVKPKQEWVESIHHNNIYYKDNILRHFPDLKNNYLDRD